MSVSIIRPMTEIRDNIQNMRFSIGITNVVKILDKAGMFYSDSAVLFIGGYDNMRKSLYSAEAESAGAPVSEAVEI